jgi:hypothetical protein
VAPVLLEAVRTGGGQDARREVRVDTSTLDADARRRIDELVAEIDLGAVDADASAAEPGPYGFRYDVIITRAGRRHAFSFREGSRAELDELMDLLFRGFGT